MARLNSCARTRPSIRANKHHDRYLIAEPSAPAPGEIGLRIQNPKLAAGAQKASEPVDTLLHHLLCSKSHAEMLVQISPKGLYRKSTAIAWLVLGSRGTGAPSKNMLGSGRFVYILR